MNGLVLSNEVSNSSKKYFDSFNDSIVQKSLTTFSYGVVMMSTFRTLTGSGEAMSETSPFYNRKLFYLSCTWSTLNWFKKYFHVSYSKLICVIRCLMRFRRIPRFFLAKDLPPDLFSGDTNKTMTSRQIGWCFNPNKPCPGLNMHHNGKVLAKD